MDWVDEHYVRLYTRDTVTWALLSWDARSVFCALLRKLDKAGTADLGRHGVQGLAELLRAPENVTRRGIDELAEAEVITLKESPGHLWIAMPNYVEAQHAVASNKLRQERWRNRQSLLNERMPSEEEKSRKDDNNSVTPGNAVLRAVTRCNENNPTQRSTTQRNAEYAAGARGRVLGAASPHPSPLGQEHQGEEARSSEQATSSELEPLPWEEHRGSEQMVEARTPEQTTTPFASQLAPEPEQAPEQITSTRAIATPEPPPPKRKGTPSPKPRKGNGRTTPEGFRRFTDTWTELYETHTGAKPSWGPKQGKLVKQLLVAQPVSELERRARVLFESPPKWLADGTPDLSSFLANLDKLAPRQPQAHVMLGRTPEEIERRRKQGAT